MNNTKWTVFAISYQCGFAYVVALMVTAFTKDHLEKIIKYNIDFKNLKYKVYDGLTMEKLYNGVVDSPKNENISIIDGSNEKTDISEGQVGR